MFRGLLLLLLCAASVLAQSSTATLTGIVTDPSDAGLANVTLRLTGEVTGVVKSTRTNAQGEYTRPVHREQDDRGHAA